MRICYRKKLLTIGFNSHLHAYNVNTAEGNARICLEPFELLDYHPLDLYYSIRDGSSYVRLKYVVLSSYKCKITCC